MIPEFTKIITVVLLITTSVHSCDLNKLLEKEWVLPPETQTGANTFGCYVNGELFVNINGSAGFGERSLYANYYLSNNYLVIYASGKNDSKNQRAISITVFNPEKDIKNKEFWVKFA